MYLKSGEKESITFRMNEGFKPLIVDMALGDILNPSELGRTPVASFLATLMLEEMLFPSPALNARVPTFDELRARAQEPTTPQLQYGTSRQGSDFQDSSLNRDEVHSWWAMRCGRKNSTFCFSWVDLLHPDDHKASSPRHIRLSKVIMLTQEEVVSQGDGWEVPFKPDMLPELWGRDVLGGSSPEGLVALHQESLPHPSTLILGRYDANKRPQTEPLPSHNNWTMQVRTAFRRYMVYGK